MADKEARQSAIKRASKQVRGGSGWVRRAGKRPSGPDTVEWVAEALVEGARDNGLTIVPWDEMSEGPKEANRQEARRAIAALEAAGWVQLTKWTCPHGHLFWVDDMTPKQCPDCGTSTLRKLSTERSNNDD